MVSLLTSHFTGCLIKLELGEFVTTPKVMFSSGWVFQMGTTLEYNCKNLVKHWEMMADWAFRSHATFVFYEAFDIVSNAAANFRNMGWWRLSKNSSRLKPLQYEFEEKKEEAECKLVNDTSPPTESTLLTTPATIPTTTTTIPTTTTTIPTTTTTIPTTTTTLPTTTTTIPTTTTSSPTRPKIPLLTTTMQPTTSTMPPTTAATLPPPTTTTTTINNHYATNNANKNKCRFVNTDTTICFIIIAP
ncbi:unnamed protein product [Orchesella dallaii]|uniref:Zonadhesin n=1 Tax=Orchesella dallaii TaxID=48710 RepID=A0ABP1RV37_9HEXA